LPRSRWCTPWRGSLGFFLFAWNFVYERQATEFKSVVNLKAAKAVGIEVPPGVLSIADEVIE
jgi:hypothetical protein